MKTIYDFAVIGGGIVGLSTAYTLLQRWPHKKVVVLEKETAWAFHQTGNNSGVIHSGIYYKPGSLKAQLCRTGCESIINFCKEHHIPFERCGKLIVATNPKELDSLDLLYDKGIKNGVEVSKISQSQAKEIEPHVYCLKALHVKSTGIINYQELCNKLVELLIARGANLHLNTNVKNILKHSNTYILETENREYQSNFLINCAGLQSDRIAKKLVSNLPAKIIPFRGEYYQLKPEKNYLVNALIYPVPNPSFPFLGVHFTRMINGSVHAGPNAVLSFKREGYQKTDFDWKDFIDVMSYPGFWKLASKHAREGIEEIVRSISKKAFVESLQQLVPEIKADDIVPAKAGVRAQALRIDGQLVDDFLIVKGDQCLNVCNAPSPAATSSLEIGKVVVEEVDSMINQ